MAKRKEPAVQTMDTLAHKVLQLDIQTLMVEVRFLRIALQQLKLQAEPQGSLSTDGCFLYYDPRYILQRYKAEPAASVRDYLHVVLHCIFRHMYISSPVHASYWDLACDIAVEEVINGMELRSAAVAGQRMQKKMLDEVRQQVHVMTAERIYRWLIEQNRSKPEIDRLQKLFHADDHALWHIEEPEEDPAEKTAGEQHTDKDAKSPPQEEMKEDGGSAEEIKEKAERQTSRAMMETIWADLAQQAEMELQAFSGKANGGMDALTQNLLAVNREKYDYAAFLKKFAVRSEVVQIDPDTFDPIFYTYGLQLYDNIPLIEPLEYKEIRKIRSFVIVIDTSGSTTGALVQRFVQKTYNILQSTESFFSKVELYILQCDDAVRESVHITNLEEFEAYLRSMQIHGHGGTDFRPAFAHVDALRRKGELQDLKGLIYFTDGYGTFPSAKPGYETAFVFVEDGYRKPDVPPWAIRLVLQPEEI